MHVARAAFVLCSWLAVALTARNASADPSGEEMRLPISRAQRPLTEPRLVLSPDVGLEIPHAAGTYGDLDVAARFGITDDLTVHALLVPLELWGDSFAPWYGQTSQEHGPNVGAEYRLIRGHFELAGDLTGALFSSKYLSGGAIIPSIPMRFHATEQLRLDAIPTFSFWIAHTDPPPTVPATVPGAVAFQTSANAVRFTMPVRALYNVTESFDMGLGSGLTIYDLSDARNTTGIPLRLFADYAIPGVQGPLGDVGAFYDIPYLFLPGRAKATNTNQWVLGLSFTAHLYL